MRTLKYEAVEAVQQDMFPRGSVELDNDGQIVIYTGLYTEPGHMVPNPTNIGYVVGETWDCPSSPHLYCEYHEATDPAHDFCVHCGDPCERK